MVSAADAKGWAFENLQGLWAPLTTPFTEDFQIDEEGFRSNVRHVMKLGIDGIYWGGVLSEPWSLSHEERKRGLEILVDEVRSRLPIYAYPVDHSISETIKLSKHAESMGIDFIMVNCPFEHVKTKEQIFRFFEILAQNTNIAICMYNTPHSGYILQPDLISKIAEIPAVCGIKDIIPDRNHTLRVFGKIGKDIVMMAPEEYDTLWFMQKCTSKTFISATSNYLMQVPEWKPIREYWDLALSGNLEKAQQVFDSLDNTRNLRKKIYEVYYKNETWASTHPLASIKFWEDYLGMSGGQVKPPLTGLTSSQKEELQNWLDNSELRKYRMLPITLES